jgi:hypothetical protein
MGPLASHFSELFMGPRASHFSELFMGPRASHFSELFMGPHASHFSELFMGPRASHFRELLISGTWHNSNWVIRLGRTGKGGGGKISRASILSPIKRRVFNFCLYSAK